MTCLVIVDSTPTDKEQLAEYSARAAKTLEPFQGKFIARGEPEALHGEAPYQRKSVIEFPDKDSALNWYNSAAYQEIIPIRNKGMDCQFHLIG
ncbi:DUF1330 domain-containing protein [Vibrio mangrovi]|uniref:DUF1330 domain-containing protein n=1 Tax=Vibrio mangrovi TaxID=474394 RepID=A0A1Y6IQJ9_9VIBR|nr:DUF1330 domain-containing protein [Vibrio mangrovi]MDW6003296.1 DUF1330 domain-containing protein [Vibrio mangrovi]SMR99915.1 hypothetical protein VIM7927_01153 [Vibrio mangrovi]